MGLFTRHGARGAGDTQKGVAGAGKIVAVRDGGTKRDLGPILDLHLLVTLPGEIPFPVSVAQPLSPALAARAKPGTRVAVHVDPATRAVAIDWEAGPA